MKHKGRKTGSRLLALLLTAAMLITAPDITALAEPAATAETTATIEGTAVTDETETSETRGTETAETEETLPAEETAVGEEEAQPESGKETDAPEDLEDEKISEEEELVLSEITETEETVSEPAEIETLTEEGLGREEELEEKSTIKADSTSPSNPVHHCTKQDDGTDYTDWSYVYFGSYPQSEVTGAALTSAITEATYDNNGDAWVNGTKYRRISKSDTNHTYYFGSSTYRYFKWERIKWRVLQNDGNTLFVIADKGLDCKNYNEEYTSITWESCTLRQWLSNDFFETAFSSAEQGAIIQQTVVNEDNPSYGTEGGNNTSDKIYLLSIGEATSPSYGFCEDYSTKSVSRGVQATAYANARGACTSTSTSTSNGYDTSWWLLRSPGRLAKFAAEVEWRGNIYRDGVHVYNDDNDINYYGDTVVPALHINLSSHLWSLTDDGTSGAGGNGGTGDNVGDSTNPGSTTISGERSKSVKMGKETFLFLYIHGANENEIDGAVNTMTITNSDESVLTVEKGSVSKGIADTNGNIQDATWLLRLYGKNQAYQRSHAL